MHARTIATLRELSDSRWFARVGVRVTERARVLSSWGEAVAACASPEWEALTQEAANRYGEQVAARAPERYRQWNDVVRDLGPTVGELVRVKTAALVREQRLPTVFTDVVRWDVLHVCLESEYADVYPPGFYAAQAYWYTAGHFPCGWDGEFPEGTLVVY